MCRSIAHGGRRCPGYHDPLRRAAYNAKRRAKYAFEKEKKAAAQSTPGIALSEEKTDAPIKVKKTTVKKVETVVEDLKKSEELKPVVEETVVEPVAEEKVVEPVAEVKKPVSKRRRGTMKALGLAKKKVNNALSRIGYLNSDVVTGTLNYDEIDENTHKKLGFSGHDIFYKDIHPDFNYKKILEVSGKEVKPLDKEEKNSLTFFTSNDYAWFNSVLYKNMAPNDKSLYSNKTSEGIKRIVSHMDAALAKAPKKQRTVYRGVNGGSQLFAGTTVHDWVDKNMVVGKDVIFDGYQSSSPNLQSANSYKGSYGGGLLYEIITPEGINVSEISMYPGEQEVILPRDARYAVVGVQKKDNDVAIVQLIAVNSKGEILDGTNADPPKDISYIDKIAEEKENVIYA